MIELNINGKRQRAEIDPATPLPKADRSYVARLSALELEVQLVLARGGECFVGDDDVTSPFVRLADQSGKCPRRVE